MRQKILFLAITLAAVGACAESERDGSQLVTAEAIMRDTEALAADEMEGRGTGQPGGEKAAQYIADRFEQRVHGGTEHADDDDDPYDPFDQVGRSAIRQHIRSCLS